MADCSAANFASAMSNAQEFSLNDKIRGNGPHIGFEKCESLC
jgi:hypothetical protein